MTLLVLLAALMAGSTLADLVSCSGKQGYAAFANGPSCFEFNSYAQTWIGSRDSCHGKGGRLAKVSDADLQNWLSTRASEQFPNTDVWIGLSDRATLNAFMWDNYDGSNTETGSYYSWNSGQPWHGINNDMNCVQMVASSGYSWRLYSCQLFFVRIYPSICEYRLESSQSTFPEVTTTKATTIITPSTTSTTTSLTTSATESTLPRASTSATTLTAALLVTPEAPRVSLTQAIPSSGSTPAGLVSCSGKQGYAAFANGLSCFEFNSYAQTWVGSRDSCHGKGGRLAKVSDANLQNWLSTRASEQFPSTDVWIGLSDRAALNAFMWDNYDGDNTETGSYYSWNTGQPWHGINNDMNCVQMVASSGYSWRLYSCQWFFVRIYPSICEYRLESSQPKTPEVKTTITSNTTTSIPTSGTASTMRNAITLAETLTAASLVTPEASALSIWLPIVIVVVIVAAVIPLTVVLVRRRRRILQQSSRVPFGHATLSTQQIDKENVFNNVSNHEENVYSSLGHVYSEREYESVSPEK